MKPFVRVFSSAAHTPSLRVATIILLRRDPIGHVCLNLLARWISQCLLCSLVTLGALWRCGSGSNVSHRERERDRVSSMGHPISDKQPYVCRQYVLNHGDVES